MVSSHRDKGRVKRSVLNNIADSLLVHRGDIETVLDTWSHDQLIEHLERHTAEQLKPLHLRR
ncbi:MAG: hypothetical protein JWO74_939 [Solirubrobacterales bacterium]|jgi:hypothetical protein|nr:hypothetical protein [Solirubrobacterales bacterium]